MENVADAPAVLFLEGSYRSTDCIGFLLARARTVVAKALDSELAIYGITHAQGNILWMLSAGTLSTATDLARELHVDAASMTRMIDRLERRSLTVRLPRGEDRRVVNLRLTPAGRILANKLPAVYTAAMNRSFAHLSLDEVEKLGSLLSKFLNNPSGGKHVAS